jgi:uncharacterized membrane protein HdeD (DUF308 family)
MSDLLFEARVRARRYWYRDGLSEMVVGIVSLLQGGWILFNHLVNSKSSWYWPGALICFLLIAAFPMARIKAAIRERFTYPRGGYVEDDESVRKRRIRVGMTLGILVTAIGTLTLRYASVRGWDPDHWIHWLPAVSGLTVGAVSVYVWVRQGLPRYLVVGLLSITIGVAVSNEYPMKLAMAIWLAGNGCAWLCSGGVALWNFVRSTPTSAAET